MLRKRYVAAPHADPTVLLPPDLRTLGTQPFTAQDHEALRAWLEETGWPRNTMNMTTLEGYLVALLVWPVDVRCGAWLPPIWGECGWKVPAKIASPDSYAKFIQRVVGFLQHLDQRLSSSPSQFAPAALPSSAPRRRAQGNSHMLWSRGFLGALQQHSQGLQRRSTAARSAVTCIARHASSIAPPTGSYSHSAAVAELKYAVMTLAAERSSRGPLGALERRSSRADPPVASRDPASPARGHHG